MEVKNINNWRAFIAYLHEQVDFRSKDKLADEFKKVESALKQLSLYPSEIMKRCQAVVEDETLFQTYAKEMRTRRVFMDKYLLYVHPERDFVVRMHRFRPTCKADFGGAWRQYS